MDEEDILHTGLKNTHAHRGPIDMHYCYGEMSEWWNCHSQALQAAGGLGALVKGISAVPKTWTGTSPATSHSIPGLHWTWTGTQVKSLLTELLPLPRRWDRMRLHCQSRKRIIIIPIHEENQNHENTIILHIYICTHGYYTVHIELSIYWADRLSNRLPGPHYVLHIPCNCNYI